MKPTSEQIQDYNLLANGIRQRWTSDEFRHLPSGARINLLEQLLELEITNAAMNDPDNPPLFYKPEDIPIHLLGPDPCKPT